MAGWLLSSDVAMCVDMCRFATLCGKTHCNGRVNVAWGLCWGGSRSTKPCIFPCTVVAGCDERYLVCAAGAAGVVPDAIGSSSVFCKEWLFLCVWCETHCSGCVKVAWYHGCMRNTIVFCSWSSKIVLEWLHQGCDSDLWADCAILVLVIFLSKVLLKNASKSSFFPRASERRGSSNSGGLWNIFSSSHIFPSSHPHIFTSVHLHIFSSSHLHILSCSLALLLSCHLAPSFFSISLLTARGSANETPRNVTLSHEMRFDR